MAWYRPGVKYNAMGARLGLYVGQLRLWWGWIEYREKPKGISLGLNWIGLGISWP
jgi:hypothetical protein